jgi:hypothetical protein
VHTDLVDCLLLEPTNSISRKEQKTTGNGVLGNSIHHQVDMQRPPEECVLLVHDPPRAERIPVGGVAVQAVRLVGLVVCECVLPVLLLGLLSKMLIRNGPWSNSRIPATESTLMTPSIFGTD